MYWITCLQLYLMYARRGFNALVPNQRLKEFDHTPKLLDVPHWQIVVFSKYQYIIVCVLRDSTVANAPNI